MLSCILIAVILLIVAAISLSFINVASVYYIVFLLLVGALLYMIVTHKDDVTTVIQYRKDYKMSMLIAIMVVLYQTYYNFIYGFSEVGPYIITMFITFVLVLKVRKFKD